MLSPRTTRTVRWLHLWTGVFVGIQIILWVVSGLVMVARPLEEVRGTTLRKEPAALSVPAGLPALQGVEKLELGSLLGKPVWKLTDKIGKRLLDASGQPIAISAAQADIGAVRTPWWRFYDLFWGLHILDWQDREDTHGPVIIIATLIALGVVLTGALLTVRHFWRR